MGSISQHKLPIINFNKDKFEPNSRESWVDKCKSVRGALEEYGCFVGVFDTISTELHDSVFSTISELFELPTQTKIQNKSTKPLYGYVGQIPFIPLYESLGIDYSNTPQGIQNFTNVMWPNGNKQFSETLLRYTKLAAAMEQMVVRMIFESYGVEKYHDAHLKSTTYLFRAMKYRAPELNESNMGFVAHTDKDFVTILHQNQVNGLEIKAKDGTWFTVELEPSSYIVMAGEAAMAWSNNRMYSPYHRVTMNYGKEARYSIAQFSFMEGKLIETPEELVDEEHPLQFKPFDHLKFLAFYDQEENRRLTSAITTYCGVGHAS